MTGKDNLGFVPDIGSQKATDNERKSQDTSDNKEDIVELKRVLGLFSGVCLIIGNIIGSGIYVTPGGILQRSGSVGASLVIWTVCGLISLLGALCYLELTLMLRTSGGDYTYISRGLGSIPSYVFAWTTCLLLYPFSQSIQAGAGHILHYSYSILIVANILACF